MEYEVVNGEIRAYKVSTPDELVEEIKKIDQEIEQLEMDRDSRLEKSNSEILELQTKRDKLSAIIGKAVNDGVMQTPDVSLIPVLEVNPVA